MKKIEYKAVVWNRIYLPDSVDLEEVKFKLQEGMDPFELCFEEGMLDSMKKYEQCEFENLLESEYVPSIEENGGYSTIEVYDKNENLIWQNGKEEN